MYIVRLPNKVVTTTEPFHHGSEGKKDIFPINTPSSPMTTIEVVWSERELEMAFNASKAGEWGFVVNAAAITDMLRRRFVDRAFEL
ncbi:hypothetical protein L2E82_19937 [Cichorium intybus]|uniref:Uncharacterized protein n=1 Tax=Cichorium intybus TaxID=13427 RepID=A0ACB9DRQ2_CICIN|nr:hypothetical protein L2E82_19937 [Cichorium intybus]